MNYHNFSLDMIEATKSYIREIEIYNNRFYDIGPDIQIEHITPPGWSQSVGRSYYIEYKVERISKLSSIWRKWYESHIDISSDVMKEIIRDKSLNILLDEDC